MEAEVSRVRSAMVYATDEYFVSPSRNGARECADLLVDSMMDMYELSAIEEIRIEYNKRKHGGVDMRTAKVYVEMKQMDNGGFGDDEALIEANRSYAEEAIKSFIREADIDAEKERRAVIGDLFDVQKPRLSEEEFKMVVYDDNLSYTLRGTYDHQNKHLDVSSSETGYSEIDEKYLVKKAVNGLRAYLLTSNDEKTEDLMSINFVTTNDAQAEALKEMGYKKTADTDQDNDAEFAVWDYKDLRKKLFYESVCDVLKGGKSFSVITRRDRDEIPNSDELILYAEKAYRETGSIMPKDLYDAEKSIEKGITPEVQPYQESEIIFTSKSTKNQKEVSEEEQYMVSPESAIERLSETERDIDIYLAQREDGKFRVIATRDFEVSGHQIKKGERGGLCASPSNIEYKGAWIGEEVTVSHDAKIKKGDYITVTANIRDEMDLAIVKALQSNKELRDSRSADKKTSVKNKV